MKAQKFLNALSINLASSSIIAPIVYAASTNSLLDTACYLAADNRYYPIGLLPRPGFYLLIIAAAVLVAGERRAKRRASRIACSMFGVGCCMIARYFTREPVAALHNLGLPLALLAGYTSILEQALEALSG